MGVGLALRGHNGAESSYAKGSRGLHRSGRYDTMRAGDQNMMTVATIGAAASQSDRSRIERLPKQTFPLQLKLGLNENGASWAAT